MTRNWLEGAAGLRQETMTKSFTKSTGKRADELISSSLRKRLIMKLQAQDQKTFITPEHGGRPPFIRITRAVLENFKTVEYGVIDFRCGK